jgi:excisionase family DNA binding protein
MNIQELYTVTDVAIATGIKKKKLYKMISRGKLKCYRVDDGNRVRLYIKESEVERLIAERDEHLLDSLDEKGLEKLNKKMLAEATDDTEEDLYRDIYSQQIVDSFIKRFWGF